MSETQSESGSADPEPDPGDAELHRLVSQLDVYRHERLAYTEMPARSARVKSRRTGRLRAIFRGLQAWFRSIGF